MKVLNKQDEYYNVSNEKDVELLELSRFPCYILLKKIMYEFVIWKISNKDRLFSNGSMSIKLYKNNEAQFLMEKGEELKPLRDCLN